MAENRTQRWSEIADYLVLYETTIRLRPPTPDERSAYHRAIEAIRRGPIPIPPSLKL